MPHSKPLYREYESIPGSIKLSFSEAIKGKGIEDLTQTRLKTVLKSGVEVEYSPLHLAIWLRYDF